MIFHSRSNYKDANISLQRANTQSYNFDAGIVDGNTIDSYSNLFYPYVSDSANNAFDVSLTIDILNYEEIQNDQTDIVNRDWIDKSRFRGNLLNAKEIWGFKECYHASKNTRCVSNAFCFGDQELSFYISTLGHGTGYVNDDWYYCKNSMTVSAIDMISGAESTIHAFSDFSSSADNANRYFSWTAPSIDNSVFSTFRLFGLVVVRIEIESEYYKDAAFTVPASISIPNKNQSNLQLLIYSAPKEISEIDAGDCNIKNGTIYYTDTYSEIFDKTLFYGATGNLNGVTDDQKRAIIADQVAVIFMSQHPVLTADYKPSKIVGWGYEDAVQPRKIIQDAITYAKNDPAIIPLVKDRMFGLFSTYKSYNFSFDIEEIISDFNQSTQYIRDPVRSIMIDDNDILVNSYGIKGISHNPMVLQTINAIVPFNIKTSFVFDCNLRDKDIDIGDILVTDEYGDPVAPYSVGVKTTFSVVYGSELIDEITYSLVTKDGVNYETYIDKTGLSRSHFFDLNNPVIISPTKHGDLVFVQINILDINGNSYSFIKTVYLDGYTEDPAIYDLSFYQRNDGSNIVDVFYTYDSLYEIDNSYLFVQFSIDNGVIWEDVPISSLKGDFGNNVMHGRRKVSWQPSVDLVNSTNGQPVLCRLTMYNVDGKLAKGNVVTGYLVWNSKKPTSAVQKHFIEKSEDRNIIEAGDTYVVSEEIEKFNFTGDNGETASMTLNGVSCTIKNENGYFVWDVDNNKYYFMSDGEYIVRRYDNIMYQIVFDGDGSLLFTIINIDVISSSSSSLSSSSSSMTSSSSSTDSSSSDSSSSSSLDSSSSSSSSSSSGSSSSSSQSV